MDAPVFVAGCACFIRAGGLFGSMPWLGAGAGLSPRRATHFLLLRQKKVSKEKATPLSASLRFASGNLRCSRPAGSRSNSLRCASLRQSRALIRWPLRSSAHPEGNPQADIHTGHCCARPSLRSARRLRPGGLGRAQQWPVWMSGFGFPSGCAEERRFWRIRARVCLSDAKRREFSETPTKLSTAGCPQRSEGTQPAGSLFLGLLSFGEAKESESPAGARPGPRTRQRHTTSYKNNSY